MVLILVNIDTLCVFLIIMTLNTFGVGFGTFAFIKSECTSHLLRITIVDNLIGNKY